MLWVRTPFLLSYSLGSNTILGLYWRSFEGVHFDALLFSGKEVSLQEIGCLYACGF
jgi:hypothetical protein